MNVVWINLQNSVYARCQSARNRIGLPREIASLNPRMRVAEILEEDVASLRPEIGTEERRARIAALLEKVGLRADSMQRDPHELSCGHRQGPAFEHALAVELRLGNERASSVTRQVRVGHVTDGTRSID